MIHRLIRALRKALPDATEEDLYWSYHFLSGALTLSLSQTGRIDRLSNGLCKSSDFESIGHRMAPFIASGFERLCTDRRHELVRRRSHLRPEHGRRAAADRESASAVGLVMSITADLTEQERKEQIRRACIYMFCILTAFLVAGGLIMNFFGISIPGLRIAGGMIVSYLGFRMLFPNRLRSRRPGARGGAGQSRRFVHAARDAELVRAGLDRSRHRHVDDRANGQHIVVGYVLVAIGIAITALISYIVLRAATRLDKVLGATGMNAMARIMGFLLICIGIQFVINGVYRVVQPEK